MSRPLSGLACARPSTDEWDRKAARGAAGDAKSPPNALNPMRIETDRLRLRTWVEDDRDAFAELNADPIVMADLGGPLSRDLSDAKLERYIDTFRHHRYGRWLLETLAGGFLGYCGVMPAAEDHPIGPHHEVGWRLHRGAWGQGYATEAARAALGDAFRRVQLTEVLAYTAVDNVRSQAVMRRLHLRRDESRDFEVYNARLGSWRGLVWSATPTLLTGS
jgi:RimJ/RimL family protein N-acetyltransferase